MKEICASMHADISALEAYGEPSPAPLRFAAATQAAVDLAVKSGLDPNAAEVRWQTPSQVGMRSQEVIFDRATRAFWKNYKERSVQQSSATAGAVLRKYSRRDCAPDVHLTIAGLLHAPLTHPVRPLEETMQPEGEMEGEAVEVVGQVEVESDMKNVQPEGAVAAPRTAEVKVEDQPQPPEEEEEAVTREENEELVAGEFAFPVVPVEVDGTAIAIVPPVEPPPDAADLDLYGDL